MISMGDEPPAFTTTESAGVKISIFALLLPGMGLVSALKLTSNVRLQVTPARHRAFQVRRKLNGCEFLVEYERVWQINRLSTVTILLKSRVESDCRLQFS